MIENTIDNIEKEPKKTMKMYQPVLDTRDSHVMFHVSKTKEEGREHVKLTSTANLLGFITHEVELE